MADQALKRGGTAHPVPKTSFWNNPDVRAMVYQVAMIAGVLGLAAYLVYNTMSNLEARSIRSGFEFLDQEAGFYIGEHLITFEASDTYGRAFIVGILNTLRVAVIGVVLATLIGTVIGIARLSKNWIVAKLASVYVESVRNVPLLLQLYFWYQIIVGVVPPVRNAIHVMPGVHLSASGINYAVPVAHPAHWGMLAAFVVGVVAAYFYRRWAAARQAATGQQASLLWPILGLVLGLPFLAWLVGGAPTAMDVPTMGTFRFTGGAQITPEFMALLAGLTIYTAGFIAEIVRSGILAVSWGQTEAASSLGLRQGLVLRLVLLPQALRVIVPPLTSQYLNLTKNSSLAVAIGYPDLVSVSNTSLNQTGQAVECIAIIMAVYLTISLSISAFMNWYNRAIALVER